MKFAYADPPYLGCGKKHYAHQHADAADYDTVDAHAALLERLRDEYPDGWAISLHTPSLEEYAHLCRRVLGPNQVRWAGWFKPFASFKPNVNPAYCWEPVVWRGGRKFNREDITVRDYVEANITLKRGTSGAKPDAFTYWLIQLLNIEQTDELHDLFPGSGAVARAFEAYQNNNLRLALRGVV